MFKKSIALILMAFVTAISAFAENKVFIPDFEVKPGETKTIELCLDIDFDMEQELQVDIYLPTGLSFASTKKKDYKDTDRIDAWEFKAVALQEDGAMRIAFLSLECEKGSDAILTFDVVASSDFTGGTIDLKNIIVWGKAYADQKTAVTTGSAGVDVKMVIDGASKYGTFVAPFDVTIPSGVKAYTATVNGEYAELTEITTTIPANTAVVVYSENAVNETFTGVAGSTPVTTGALTGVFAATEATVGTYVLQNQGGVVAFYLVNSVKPTIGANRCYLTASSSAKAIYFDEATAIAALQNASSIEAAYSASGVKNNGLKKGVNIVKMGDGSVQKIMVK